MGGVKSLSDARVVAEMVRVLGLPRTATVIGYCAVLAAGGIEKREDIVASAWLGRRTAYRVLGDIHRVRDSLRAQGHELSPDSAAERTTDPDVELVRTIGRVAV